MPIIRKISYSFSEILADTPAYIVRTKSVTFKNLGASDVYFDGIKTIIAGDSLSLGGLQDKDIDDIFAITFTGGVGQLLVITEGETTQIG